MVGLDHDGVAAGGFSPVSGSRYKILNDCEIVREGPQAVYIPQAQIFTNAPPCGCIRVQLRTLWRHDRQLSRRTSRKLGGISSDIRDPEDPAAGHEIEFVIGQGANLLP
jgi:hypothetical protein